MIYLYVASNLLLKQKGEEDTWKGPEPFNVAGDVSAQTHSYVLESDSNSIFLIDILYFG